MVALYIALGVIAAGATIYFVRVSREFRKFLSGAFFVSGGIQLYLYLADVSVPLIGTSFVQTPQVSAVRSVPHLIFSILCFYFGFIRKPK
jgi:hypothetical protein